MPDERKRKDDLRHWSTYRTASEWFADHHGFVPIQMAAALGRTIGERGLSFPNAYRHLLGMGAIIHLDPADDEIPVETEGLQ
jgi:hypothetical protein